MVLEIRSFCGLCAFLGTFLLWFYGYTNVNVVEITRTRRFLVPLEVGSPSRDPIHEVVQNVCHNTENIVRAEAIAKHLIVDQAHKVVYCR